MIWIRLGLLAAFAAVVVLALTQTTPQPAPEPASADLTAANAGPRPSLVVATAQATRVPLPTALPQMITLRLSHETPLALATSTPSAHPSVTVVDNAYVPPLLTLQVGASVTWTNSGSEGHDVIGSGPGGAWHSGPLAPAERYERIFALAGDYDYACTVHPEMRGRVVVQP